MTTEEMIVQVFHDSGEPEDMQIYTTPGDDTTFDITLPGSARILRMLNTALVRIANWRFRDGRVLRLRSLRGRTAFNTGDPATGTVISAGPDSAVIPGLSTNYDDEFDGWIIKIDGGTGSGQTASIRASILSGTDIEVSVDPAWTTVPDATSTYSLYKSFFEFIANPTLPWEAYHIPVDPTRHMGDIIRVRDVTGLTDLGRASFDDMFTASIRNVGIPTQWRTFGDQLWFDAAPSSARTYELLYVRNPAVLAAAADVPDIPEMYHAPATLWATHDIMRRHQDFNAAYATKRELEDEMEMLRLQGTSDADADMGVVVVWG